MNYIIW